MKKSQFTESQIVAILKDGEARGWSVNATLLCCLSGVPLESNGASSAKDASATWTQSASRRAKIDSEARKRIPASSTTGGDRAGPCGSHD
jgi:hypothetical protein